MSERAPNHRLVLTEQRRRSIGPDTEERTQRDLHLARAQGDAYGEAFEHLRASIASDSGERYCGDYQIGYAVGPAEGAYEWSASELVWLEPRNENLHVAVTVRDAGDGRFVPGLRVLVTLIDPRGRALGTHEHPMLWHPMLHHYGSNWKISASGLHSLRIEVEPPRFIRADPVNGSRLAAPTSVQFDAVNMNVGTG
ncbi:MAG TPA: hypothetical protein VMA77_17145 [Solirubrobacteraceae bacterium]|nr:hypothetical protein [Solirubrobacteraceae bacterium]